jgi:hypothetical protein
VFVLVGKEQFLDLNRIEKSIESLVGSEDEPD